MKSCMRCGLYKGNVWIKKGILFIQEALKVQCFKNEEIWKTQAAYLNPQNQYQGVNFLNTLK